MVRDVLVAMEDHRVVGAQPGKQELEDVLVRRGEIDVAAPDPVAAVGAGMVDHTGGLRVVDDHVVEGIGERLRVPEVVAPEDLLLVLGERTGRSLETVVDRLRDVEELLLPVDDPPLGVEARVAHERDERVEDLGDAATERGRGEVEDALAGKRLGERLQLLHQPPARDRRVVRQGLMADVYLL